MIARHWHGKTPAAKAENYKNFLKKVAVPDYQSTEGFLGLKFLSRIENDEAHFDLLTFWTGYDAIRRFAGDDIQMAKYYPEDKDFLLEFEEKVQHYEVFAQK